MNRAVYCSRVFAISVLFTLVVCCLSSGAVLTSCSGDPAADVMRGKLLQVREMNQKYIPLTVQGDSQSVQGDLQSPYITMREVTDYYDRHGTRSERVEAHYLLGCVCRDMGEAPQALQCYQDAVELADTTDDRRLLIKVYGQMAELFDAQNLPGDEIAAMRRIQHYALLEHDSLMYIRALELMTKPYYKLGDTAKVIETIWQANRLYTEAGDSQRAANAFATLAHIMVKRGQLEEADRLLREYETKTGLFDSCGNIQRGYEMYYYIKGNYYLETGNIDSAETLFRRILFQGICNPWTPTLSLDADACRGLLSVYYRRVPKDLQHVPRDLQHVSRDLQSLDSIVKYARLFETAIDSLNNKRRTETVHQMAALYDYQRLQQKADMEALAASKAEYHANIAIVVIAMILIAICTLFIRYRSSKHKQIEKLGEDCLIISAQLDKARMELEEQRRAAENQESLEAEMQEKMEEKSNEVRELEDRLQQIEVQYRSVTQLASLEKRKNNEAVKAIRKKAEWKYGATLPSADDWIKLANQFRLDFPIYYAALTQGNKLSANELRTCMLLMLDFKEGEIAVLLDVKPQRVTNIKKRVNMKLFDDISATTLISNIQAASS